MTKVDLRKQKKKAKRAVRKANAMEPYRPGKYLTPMDLMKRYYGNGVSYSGMSGGGAPSSGPGLTGLLGEVMKIGGALNSLLESKKATRSIQANMGIDAAPPVAAAAEPTPPPSGPNTTPFARPPAPPMENRLVVPGRRRGRETDEFYEPLDTIRRRTEREIVDGVNRTMEEGARRWANTRPRQSSDLLRIAGYENQLVEPNVSNIPPPHSNRAPPLLAIQDGSALEEERPIIQSDFTRRDLTIDDDDEGIVVPSSSSIVRFQEPVVNTVTPQKAENPNAGIDDLTQLETVADNTFQIPEQVEVVPPPSDDVSALTTPLPPQFPRTEYRETTNPSISPSDVPPVGGPSMTDTMLQVANIKKGIDDELITGSGNVVVKSKKDNRTRGGVFEKMGILKSDALMEELPSGTQKAAEILKEQRKQEKFQAQKEKAEKRRAKERREAFQANRTTRFEDGDYEEA